MLLKTILHTYFLFDTFTSFVQILYISVNYLNKLLPEAKKGSLISSANKESKLGIEMSFLKATIRWI